MCGKKCSLLRRGDPQCGARLQQCRHCQAFVASLQCRRCLNWQCRQCCLHVQRRSCSNEDSALSSSMRQCKQLLVKYVERGMTLPGYGRAGPSLPPRWQDNVFSGKWSVLGWSERKLLHQGAFFCPRIDRALHWNFRSLGQKFFGGSSRDWSCCWKRGGARYGSGKTQIKRTGRSSGQEGNLLIYLF